MKISSYVLLVSAVLLGACEQDSGSGGGATKQSECIRMYSSYCAKEVPLCDDAMARDCSFARRQACEERFDGTCGANDDVTFSVDHEIDMIIEPKGTCDALRSIDSHVWDTIVAWDSEACEGGGGSGSTTTFSQLCENAAAGTCNKMLTLSCVTGTATECEQLLLSQGAITFGGDTCSLTSPNTDATAAQQTDYDTWMAAVTAAADCAAFGL